MDIHDILNFIKEWQDFIGPISIIGISTAAYKYYFAARQEKIEYDKEQWKLIKSTKNIQKKDFNVSTNKSLKKRPSESRIKEFVLENKKNVLFIGGNEPNLKYGKSTLLYSILKKKQLKKYVVLIPNLSSQIKFENEISIPIKWLNYKTRKFILLVEDINNYKDYVDTLLIYYKLLSKKSSSVFMLVTSDQDFEIDWGEEMELNFHKIKLSPIDKINEKDTLIINNLTSNFNSLNSQEKKILFYLNLCDKTGLKSHKQFIYNILSFEVNDLIEEKFVDRLLTLQALEFINWFEDEILLKKSKLNPDFSNYELIETKEKIRIDPLVNYFIHIKQPNGLIHCSNVYNRLKEFAKSKNILKKIISFQPNHHKAKFLLGQTYLNEYQNFVSNKNRYKIELLDTALSWYEKACEENDNFYGYKLSLAYCLIKRGQSPKNSEFESQKYFEEALNNINKTKNSINLDYYSYIYAYAFLYKRLKIWDTSLKYYRKALTLNFSQFNHKLFTEYAELLLLINKSDFKLNYKEKIEEYLLESLKSKPNNYYKTDYVLADFYNWRSRDPKCTNEIRKKFKKLSVEHYEAAFECSNKKYIHALKGKAKVLISLGEIDDGIKVLEQIVTKNPNDFYSLKSIGTAYSKKQDVVNALSYYLKSLDKNIDLGYINTLKVIKKRKYPQLFKELSELYGNESFIDLLKSSKGKTNNLLTKKFIDLEIDYSIVSLYKEKIDNMIFKDSQIKYGLNEIKNPDLQDFKNKTLSLYYLKLGDIESARHIRLEMYEKAKNKLLETYSKRRKKPQSYYKHLIVIDGKISLIDGKNEFEPIIKKFERQILHADLTYAEIHFEFAKYLEELIKVKYNYSNTLTKCIEQYEIAHKKFLSTTYNFEEIEYCEARLSYLKSAPNIV